MIKTLVGGAEEAGGGSPASIGESDASTESLERLLSPHSDGEDHARRQAAKYTSDWAAWAEQDPEGHATAVEALLVTETDLKVREALIAAKGVAKIGGTSTGPTPSKGEEDYEPAAVTESVEPDFYDLPEDVFADRLKDDLTPEQLRLARLAFVELSGASYDAHKAAASMLLQSLRAIFAADHPALNLAVECLLANLNNASDGLDSQASIGRRYGLTRAAISKKMKDMREGKFFRELCVLYFGRDQNYAEQCRTRAIDVHADARVKKNDTCKPQSLLFQLSNLTDLKKAA